MYSISTETNKNKKAKKKTIVIKTYFPSYWDQILSKVTDVSFIGKIFGGGCKFLVSFFP